MPISKKAEYTGYSSYINVRNIKDVARFVDMCRKNGYLIKETNMRPKWGNYYLCYNISEPEIEPLNGVYSVAKSERQFYSHAEDEEGELVDDLWVVADAQRNS